MKRAKTNAQNVEPKEVPASESGQGAPRSVQMPNAGQKEGLKLPKHRSVIVVVSAPRTSIIMGGEH
eukprot:2909701-Pleurochrysis_carterae.AAC.1